MTKTKNNTSNREKDYFRMSERGYMMIPMRYIKSDEKKLWAYAYTMACRMAMGNGVHAISFHDYLWFMFTDVERKRINMHDEYEYFRKFYAEEFNVDVNKDDVTLIADYRWRKPCSERYATIFCDELMKMFNERTSSRKKLFKVLCIYRLNMNTRDYNKNNIEDIQKSPRYLSCYHSDFVRFENMGIKSRQTIGKMFDRLEEIEIIKQYREKKCISKESGGFYTPHLFITDCYELDDRELASAVERERHIRSEKYKNMESA